MSLQGFRRKQLLIVAMLNVEFFMGFYGLSRLFHSVWAEQIVSWDENELSKVMFPEYH